MHGMRSWLALATLVGFANSVAFAQDSTKAAPTASEFAAPEHVGRYTRTEMHDYGKPELGVAYQYRLPAHNPDSAFATFYIYQRDSNQRTLSADSLLKSQGAGFKEALEVMRRRGDYDLYRVAFEASDSVMVDGAWKIPGYHLAYVFRRGQTTAASFLYLFVSGNTLLEVRGTVPAERFQNTDLPSFAHDVVAQAAKTSHSSH
ncbi:MAG TPA: hypothetical protein VJ865_13530 [Gemmatimonadaceae bacterium]|nr:hypothetical protein [Gemmatimonadaceae bacterium]